MPHFKLCKPAIAKLTPFFLFALSCSLSTVPPFPTPYSPLPAAAQTADTRQAEADRLMKQGIQQHQTSQFQAALNSWQQAFQIYRALQNRNGEAWSLMSLGVAYDSLSQYGKAIKYHQQALPIFRSVGDRNGEANALMNLGVAYDSLSQYGKAIEYHQQALPIFRSVGDRTGEARSLGNLGIAYRSLSQYGKAIEYYQQALPIFRAARNRNDEANTLNNLGIASNSLSQYGKAIEYYQQALPIFRAVGNRSGEANALMNLGIASNSLSQYGKAIESYRQALLIFRAVSDRSGEASALSNLGIAYRSLAQYDKAIKYHQQALPIFQQVGDRNGEANALMSLGVAYRALSQYGKAIEYYQQALPIFRAVSNRNGEAGTLSSLGNAYSSLSQHGKAIESYQQALPIFRAVGDRNGEAGTLTSLGIAYSSLSQYGKAIELYSQALLIFRQVGDRNNEATVLINLGKPYRALSQYGKAIESLQQALPIFRAVGDRQGEAATLTSLGNVYASLLEHDRAIESYRQALPMHRAIGDRAGEGLVLNNLGYTFLRTENFPVAEKNFFAAITVWESLRPGLTDENKISLFDQQSSAYRGAQQALIAQNQSGTALEIAERGRARAFVELLAERFNRQVSDVKSQAAIQAPNLQQIRQIASAQNATLVQYSIIYSDFQIQGKSESREAALYVWVIQPTGQITFRQVDFKPLWQQHHASLADLIIGNQEFLAVRSRGTGVVKLQPNLPTLHQLLIDPIVDLLPKDPNAHVIFIPQGALFQVPFPALQDANGTYLIQKHTILTAPSIQVLALTRQQQQKLASQPANGRGKALVLGNPIMPQVSLSPGEPKQALSPLPGAEAEAKAIAPLLNTQPIIGAQGTKAAIVQKMPQASIIHLATHGLLDDVRGLGSAIALAPSGTDDGWLTADEILNMKLQANLVVLSACNTAGGRITGDGVIGLSRSLISAGVPSVIVSLWSVPDAPTAALMQAFYQNLQKHPDKAQALRQAMLTTMKTHPQPRDWAAFTLIGEAK